MIDLQPSVASADKLIYSIIGFLWQLYWKLIWSASSESVDPDSMDTIIHELIDAVVNKLLADGLVGG